MGKTLSFHSMREGRVRVRSLVGELISHMLWGVAGVVVVGRLT